MKRNDTLQNWWDEVFGFCKYGWENYFEYYIEYISTVFIDKSKIVEYHDLRFLPLQAKAKLKHNLSMSDGVIITLRNNI